MPRSETADETETPRDLETVAREHYAIGQERGRGGLGRVLEARDRRLDRTVAVKELLVQEGQTEARFVREALVTARLQHPAIVPIYEAGRWPSGEPFYTMKMVEGRSLKRVIAETPTLEERMALLPNVIAVSDAIAYAHSQGVIHRDLKPANIMIGPFGETFVIDWGLAKTSSESIEDEEQGPYAVAAHDLTVMGAVVGTPQYMPPEQAEGKPVDERADVYALGAILYHVLAGKVPFEGEDSASVLAKVREGPPPDVDTRIPRVAQDLAAIVRKAMARNPKERYPTAAELAEDLKRFQTGQLVRVHEYSTLTLFRRWVARHRGAIAVGAVALVVLAVLAVVSVWRIVEERSVAQSRSQALTLIQARSSLDKDPTAAIAWLKTYPKDGPDWAVVQSLAADAENRGVAQHVIEAVGEISYSPDGRLLAGTGEGQIRVWDAESGRLLGERDADSKSMLVAFSPDGERIVAAGQSGDVFLWDRPAGTVRRLRGHADGVVGLSLSTDGRLIATAGDDKSVRLWDARSGSLRAVLSHSDSLKDIAFSPDGRHLASICRDYTVRLWDVHILAARLLPLPDRKGSAARSLFRRLVFSPDGRFLATTAADHDVVLWELPSGVPRAFRGHTGNIMAVAFAPDGTRFASAGIDSDVRVWDVETGNSRVFRGHEREIQSLAFSPDGRTLVSASFDGTVRLWRVETAECRVLRGHERTIFRVRFSPNGRQIAALDSLGVRVWPSALGPGRILRGADNVQTLAFSPDSAALAWAGRDPTIRIWSADTVRPLSGHANLVANLGFSPDGKILASGAFDGIRLWDTSTWTGQVLGTEADRVLHVQFSPDGRRLASGHGDGTIRVRDLATGAGRVLSGHKSQVYFVTFSPRGDKLASGSGDGTARVWDLATGQSRVALGYEPWTLVFSPDGHFVAFPGKDGTALVWDLSSGVLRHLGSRSFQVHDVAWLPDGRLATAGGDRLVRIWDVAGARALRVLSGNEGEITNVAVSPSGSVVASGGLDCAVRIWNLSTGATRVLHRFDLKPFDLAFSPDGRWLASGGQDSSVWVGSVDPGAGVPAGRDALVAWLAHVTTATIDTDSQVLATR